MSCRDMYVKLSNVVGTAQASYDMVDQNGFYAFQRKTYTELTNGITVSVVATASRFTLSNFIQSGSYGPCWNPVDANTLLLLHFDGSDGSTTFTDSSQYARGITANGQAQMSTAQFKFDSSSLLLDGSGGTSGTMPSTRDVLSLSSASDFNFGTGSFTIDFWARFAQASQTGGNRVVWGKYVNSNTFIGLLFGADGIAFGLQNAATWVINFNSTGATYSHSTWYHVALVRNYTTGVATDWNMYVNGNALGRNLQLGSWGASITNSATTAYLGSLLGYYTGDFNGHIDEFRISNVARWTSNFTPPTAPY